MIHVDPTAPEPALLAFLRTFFTHTAKSEWDAALAMLEQPNRFGTVWTRELILKIVNDSYSPGTHFVTEFGPPFFSPPTDAKGSESFSFKQLEDGSYFAEYDVPLNGHFSELTAQFYVHRRADGFVVVLDDLLVP